MFRKSSKFAFWLIITYLLSYLIFNLTIKYIFEFIQSYKEPPNYESEFEPEIHFLRNYNGEIGKQDENSLVENQYKIQAEILQQRVDTLECEKNHWLIERERLQEENEKLKQQLEYADLPDLEEIPIIIID